MKRELFNTTDLPLQPTRLPPPTVDLASINKVGSITDLSNWSVIDDHSPCSTEVEKMEELLPIQRYSCVSGVPGYWQYYLHKMYKLLALYQITEEQFNNFIIESAKSHSHPQDEVPVDFETTLKELIYRDVIPLQDSLPINANTIYQMWLYFRLHDDMALSYCPDLEGLEEEITYNEQSIRYYSAVYHGYFKALFRSLLNLAGYRRKQIFLVIIDGDNRDHLLFNYQPHSVGFDGLTSSGPGHNPNPEVFEIESDFSIELRDLTGQDKILYVLSSAE